jgi:hypothetical protein
LLLIWITIHVSTLKEPSSGVSNYTLLITELQRQIPKVVALTAKFVLLVPLRQQDANYKNNSG